jgi:uncharacterized membrane protein AbrB (regulator of aidB expression)
MQFLNSLKAHFNILIVLPSFWFIFGVYHAAYLLVDTIRVDFIAALLNAIPMTLAYVAYWLSKKYQEGKGE